MESNTAISLGVSSIDRHDATEDKASTGEPLAEPLGNDASKHMQTSFINPSDAIFLKPAKPIVFNNASSSNNESELNIYESISNQPTYNMTMMPDKYKIALVIFAGIILTAPCVVLTIWGVEFRDEEHLKPETTHVTTIGQTDHECLRKSVNDGSWCNDSVVTELTVSKEETITKSPNNTLKMRHKTASRPVTQKQMKKRHKTTSRPVTQKRMERSHWLKSLESYYYISIKHLQYKLDRKITFDGHITSMQVIGEELWVATAIGSYYYCLNILSRDGKQVRKYQVNEPIYKVIQADTGEFIAASGSHGLNIINRKGQVIQRIYNNEQYGGLLDVVLWKGKLYALSGRRVYAFTHLERGSWEYKYKTNFHRPVNMAKKVLRYEKFVFRKGELYNKYQVGKHNYIYVLSIKGRKIYNYCEHFVHLQVSDDISHLCGVDGDNMFVIAAKDNLHLCTGDGNCSGLSLNTSIEFPEHVVIDPEDNGLWISMQFKKNVYKFVPI